LGVLVSACSGSGRIANDNLANLYNPARQEIKPEFVIFHKNDQTSIVYFKLWSENLLYTRRGESDDFTAAIKVGFVVNESFSSNAIADSGSFVITDTNNARVPKLIEGSFEISALYPNYYVLRLFTADLNKNTAQESLVPIDKSSRLGRENFRITQKLQGDILFSKYLDRDTPLRIECNDPTHKYLFVSYYLRDFPLSPPPFNSYTPGHFDFTPDSFYVLERNTDHTFDFVAEREGMFHIQTDTGSRQGLTFFRFETHFPQVRAVAQLIPPTRFISTNREYEKLIADENSKQAVDKFWLNLSPGRERARELVSNYYGRVEYANRFFSTHTRGWSTDRGLIYIIFGTPGTIYNNGGGESWIYGTGKGEASLTFNFQKVSNPFSDNDYRLSRSPEYKAFWYKAVDTWRQGRVYTY
jgi:GWxTD domain-containing protein